MSYYRMRTIMVKERFTELYVIFYEAVARTSDEIDILIDSFTGSEAADPGRTGLVGYSMGGCIIYDYLTREKKKIKAAVSVIATPDWVSLMMTRDASNLMKNMGVAKSDKDMDRILDIARIVQPVNKLESMYGVPLLILNGETDSIIPVGPVREFFCRLQETSCSKEDIRLVIYSETGHVCMSEMDLEAKIWLKRYL